MTNAHSTTIYLASYKSTRTGWRGVVDRVIRFFTKSGYSHSELCVGHPFCGPVDCLSSSSAEGGVRIKRMQLNPEKWDLIALPWVDEATYRAFYADHGGRDYDWLGTVRTILPFVGREHPTKWFCSEVCAAIMGTGDAWRMHPGVLHVVAAYKEIGKGD